MIRNLFFVALTMFCGGCASVVQYDPVTAQQIEATLEYEKADYAAVLTALEECGSPEAVATMFRHLSEIARLEAWLEAENAKQFEVSP